MVVVVKKSMMKKGRKYDKNGKGVGGEGGLGEGNTNTWTSKQQEASGLTTELPSLLFQFARRFQFKIVLSYQSFLTYGSSRPVCVISFLLKPGLAVQATLCLPVGLGPDLN